MTRALILTGGIFHPFAETSAEVARQLVPLGIRSDLTEDVEGGLKRLADYELVLVQGLRWTMTQHEKYAPHRAQWALSLSAAGRAAIVDHLARGRGLIGLHTASICFDDWPEWGATLGAAWRWGRSGHPAIGSIEVAPRATQHPVLAGISPFTVEDELYGDLDLAPDVTILAEARVPGGAWQPVVLAREATGRAVYIALGHDLRSVATATHARLLRNAAAWCLRQALPQTETAA